MLAIIKTGGKQYKVVQDNIIRVEKLPEEEGKKIKLSDVLLIEDGDGTQFFNPEKASVEIEILRQYKDKKVIIFKKRRRQNSRRKNGHRQQKTEIKILSINL
jgi:large subunit ribosomal protein L21